MNNFEDVILEVMDRLTHGKNFVVNVNGLNDLDKTTIVDHLKDMNLDAKLNKRETSIMVVV